MDTPGYAENTIRSYRMESKDIYGKYGGSARYDLIEVVTICLGRDSDKEKSELMNV